MTLPPLRSRKGDIPQLVSHFVEKFSKSYDKPVKGLAPGALNLLLSHDWPGNVRELENCIERAVALGSEDSIEMHDLPPAPSDANKSLACSSEVGPLVPYARGSWGPDATSLIPADETWYNPVV